MSWVRSGQFRLVTNRPGKRYVFRRNNTGNSEYNVPNSVQSKRDAIRYLSSKRNLRPNRHQPIRPKKETLATYTRARQAFKRGPSPKRKSPLALPYHPAHVPGSPQYPGVFSCASGKGLKLLGKGRQGIAFKGNGFAAKVCPRDLAAEKRGEKQPARVEYDIHTAAFKACPTGVVEPYDFHKCINFINPSTMNMANVQNSRKYDKSKQSIIFMEWCEGGSLEEWLPKNAKSDAVMHHLISSVLKSLAKIYKKYPDFRHNDLWPANIFVANRGFLIGDFGWARLEKSGTNPAVNTANGTNTAGKWGVGPSTDTRYDYHFFLNNIRDFVKRKGGLPKSLEFLDWAVPPGYRGSSDTHVNEWRLKYNDPCPDLKSFNEILRSKYISGRKITSPDLVAARSRLRSRVKVTSANLVAARSRLRKVRVRPKKRVSSLNLRAAKRKLKPVRPRRVISPAQLVAARSKLKEGLKTKTKIPAALMKNSHFNKIVEHYWRNDGAKSGKNYEAAWDKARHKAVRLVEMRLNRGNRPLTPIRGSLRKRSPKAGPAPARRVSPPPPGHSGRPKIMGSKGRMVYANLHFSLVELKKLAGNKGINIKGLRSKANIARKIFT